jgi:hypothetical protein
VSILDPKEDAKDFGPVIDQDLKDTVDALMNGLRELRDETKVTITISFERKGN